jgi:hypothetical protein
VKLIIYFPLVLRLEYVELYFHSSIHLEGDSDRITET